MAKHRIELETNEVNQVLNILAARPFNEVAQLITRITQQLDEQRPPANGAAPSQPAAANG